MRCSGSGGLDRLRSAGSSRAVAFGRGSAVDSSHVTGLILKTVAIAVAVLVVGLIGIVVFTDVWAQVGIGAAILVICAPLLIWAWNMDRKEKAQRQGLEDI